MRITTCNPDTLFNRELFDAVEKNDTEKLELLLQENQEDVVDLYAKFRCPGNSEKPQWKNIVWFSCKSLVNYENKLETLRLLLSTPGAKRTLNASLTMISIAKIKQLNLAEQLKMLKEFGADPSITNHLGLNTLHFLMESKRYCHDTIRTIFNDLGLDEAARLVNTPYPEKHGLTKWRGLTPIQIATREKHLHGLIKFFKKQSAVKEWRPNLHWKFSRRLRFEIRTLVLLAGARLNGEEKTIKDGGFAIKCSQACLDLLPAEILQYLFVFVASPPFPVIKNAPEHSKISFSNTQAQQARFLVREHYDSVRWWPEQAADREAEAFDSQMFLPV